MSLPQEETTEILIPEDVRPETFPEIVRDALAPEVDFLEEYPTEPIVTMEENETLSELLTQIQVTNRLLTYTFGLLLFIVGFLLMDWVYKLIQHNVTNFF